MALAPWNCSGPCHLMFVPKQVGVQACRGPCPCVGLHEGRGVQSLAAAALLAGPPSHGPWKGEPCPLCLLAVAQWPCAVVGNDPWRAVGLGVAAVAVAAFVDLLLAVGAVRAMASLVSAA